MPSRLSGQRFFGNKANQTSLFRSYLGREKCLLHSNRVEQLEAEFHSDCKPLHRQQYYEALDLVTTSIKERFHQKGFQVYRNLEDLLLCVRGQDLKEALTQVTDFYREDLDADQLKAHLIVFSTTYSGGTEWIGDIRTYLKGLSSCLLYTSPSPRDLSTSRMPSSA